MCGACSVQVPLAQPCRAAVSASEAPQRPDGKLLHTISEASRHAGLARRRAAEVARELPRAPAEAGERSARFLRMVLCAAVYEDKEMGLHDWNQADSKLMRRTQ